MNKKAMLAVGLCVVLLVCSVIYFRPLPLSSCIPENGSSDGAMENSGSKVLSIYMIDKDAVVGSIYVSEAGRISINDRPYKMKNAKQFQEQLEAILKE